MKLIDSLSYQPTVLPFGTSGLRGLARDMTDLECYINALGFVEFLQQQDGLQPGEAIYIAGDLRTSTPRIMRAVAAALANSGCRPVNCGLIPTPALAFYALTQHSPCVMITGSHIPADRNGIKFYKRAGEVLKPDEAAIRGAVGAVRERLYAAEAATSAFAPNGMLRTVPELASVDAAAEHAYRERYMSVLPANCLQGLTLAVYQQSAVARDLLVDIFEALGARVMPLARSDTFVPIDTENVTPEDTARFSQLIRECPGAFALISADGDSDRPIVVDEHGTFHRGDVLGALVATHLNVHYAALPITSNDAIDQYAQTQNLELIKTKVGSPYVIAAMDAAPAAKRPVAGWEVNGGFLTDDAITFGHGTIAPLPTRDALLPILAILLMARHAGKSLSELFAQLPDRYNSSGLIDDVPERELAAFRAVATDKAKMEQLAHTLFDGSKLGPIRDINLTDGLRIRFTSGDIIHFRPSGNAPQFRVYSEADRQERANQLVADSVAPGGYLERLIKQFS